MNDESGRTMIEYSARVPLKKELVNKGLLKSDYEVFSPTTWGSSGSADDFDPRQFADVESTNPVMRIERYGDIPGFKAEGSKAADDKTGYGIVKFWYPAGTTKSHIDAFNNAQLGLDQKNKAREEQLGDVNINKTLAALEGQVVKGPDGNDYLVKNGVLIKQ